MQTRPGQSSPAPMAALAEREAVRSEQRDRTGLLILGLGNPLLGDDSVGLRIAQCLRAALARVPGVEVEEDYAGGLRLMERLIGYRRAILIDAMQSGAAPGTVRVLAAEDAPTRHSDSVHDVDLATALAIGRQIGAPLPAPDDLRVVGVEARNVDVFSEECTPAVEASIAKAVEVVVHLVQAWR